MVPFRRGDRRTIRGLVYPPPPTSYLFCSLTSYIFFPLPLAKFTDISPYSKDADNAPDYLGISMRYYRDAPSKLRRFIEVHLAPLFIIFAPHAYPILTIFFCDRIAVRNISQGLCCSWVTLLMGGRLHVRNQSLSRVHIRQPFHTLLLLLHLFVCHVCRAAWSNGYSCQWIDKDRGTGAYLSPYEHVFIPTLIYIYECMYMHVSS